MLNPETIGGETGALFDRVLRLDPANARALWYGGLASQIRGDETEAVARWKQLLAQEIPPEFRRVLESRIVSIAPAALDALVLVEVNVAQELLQEIPQGAVLFVALRAVEGGVQGPPVAARRLEFFNLPETVPVMPGDLLQGGMPEGGLRVIARISASGEASGSIGDIEGQAEWRPGERKTVKVVLDTRRGE